MPKDISKRVNRVLITIGCWKLQYRKIHGRNLQDHFKTVKCLQLSREEGPEQRILFDIEPVVFNYRVAQQTVAGVIDLLPGDFFVTLLELNFEVLTYMNRADARVTHLGKSVLNRFPLRIEHSFLWCNDYFGFHQSPKQGRLTANDLEAAPPRMRAFFG